MSPPWMPLYVADYLADTTHLSAAEHGAYLLLIMNYWQKGGLPQDEALLARICRMSPREWGKSRDVLRGLFGDGWTHHRIDSELEKARVKSEARAECGSRGGKAKALKDNDARLAIATNLPDENVAKAIASSSQPHSLDKSKEAHNQREREREAEFSTQFWPEYPHKVGKPVALKSYLSARNRASAEKIMAGLRAYVAGKPAGRDWLNPATFLNQDRFDDAPAPVAEDAKPRAGPVLHPPQEIRNPALRALQRLSQKNAQRTDEQDIFAPRSGPCQPSSSAGNPGDETGAEARGFGPVLSLAAYR